MKLYRVTYDGLWLGGCAIILADSEYEALKLVANDKTSTNPTNMKAFLLTEDLTKPFIALNDNGDY